MDYIKINLPKDLVDELDKFAKENGYNNRNECLINIIKKQILAENI